MKYPFPEPRTPLEGLEQLCSMVRGAIIHQYTSIEILIDGAIKQLLFDGENAFEYYSKLLNLNKINATTKAKVLKHCLEKYDGEHNRNTSDIRDKLLNLTENRNMMAHWPLDITDKGQELFIKQQKFRLKTIKSGVIVSHDFGFDVVASLAKDAAEIKASLIEIHLNAGGWH